MNLSLNVIRKLHQVILDQIMTPVPSLTIEQGMAVEQDAAVGQAAVGQNVAGGRWYTRMRRQWSKMQEWLGRRISPPKQSRRGLRSQIRLGKGIPWKMYACWS